MNAPSLPGEMTSAQTAQTIAEPNSSEQMPAPPATTWVLLIRHGENEWVSTGRLAGRTEGVLLNDRGRAQAHALANFLAHQSIEAIYSSPLERCLETAEPLAQHLKIPVQVEESLVEADYGEWQGKELKELSKGDEWSMVQHYPSAFRFPGGETLRHTQQRAVDGIERIVAEHPDGVVALFSHGDVIRTVLAHYAGVPLDLFQRLQISTGSVTTLAFLGGRPIVMNVNVTPTFDKIKRRRDQPPPKEEQSNP